MSDEVSFLVFSEEAWVGEEWTKVHVHDPAKVRDINPTVVFMMGFLGVTVCGLEVYQGRGGGFVGEFSDEALCINCHKWYSGSKEDLFKHELVLESL